MSQNPVELKYTESHEWVKVDGDIATVGITDFAQSELGDIVFVSLPEPGRILKKGDSFGAVESVKTASDLYTPVSGEVIEANVVATMQTELVNTDPYGKGYLVKLRLSNPSEADALLSSADYGKLAH